MFPILKCYRVTENDSEISFRAQNKLFIISRKSTVFIISLEFGASHSVFKKYDEREGTQFNF